MKKYNNRHITCLLLALTMAACGSTGCAASVQAQNISIPSPQPVSNSMVEGQIMQVSAKVTSADTDAVWDEASSTKVILNGTSISVKGSGATANGSTLTITKAGTYVINGTLTDGQIVVNAAKDEKVRLVLNNANITHLTGAPIYASSCDKLIVILAEGTTNTLTDGGVNFKYENTTDEEPNAALFCKDDLTINGSGTLSVNAGFNNGIGTKDDLVIVNGGLIVNAANHGLRGNDSITVLDGNFKITTGNDGIQTNNTKDAEKGYIIIESGTFKIVSAHDGIQADASITVNGGGFDITAGGGVAKTQTVTSADTVSDSFKGLKAAGDILITTGNFNIDSYDDSIHSNGNITISSGDFVLASGDDGVHADGDLTVSSGNVNVTASYEGLEGANLYVTDGVINVVASDDGLNAAGGSSNSSAGSGRFGKDTFAAGGNHSINISGGQITINAGGDGVDSNGDIHISGGTVVSIISSKQGMGDGGMDCDGTFTLTDGTVIYGGTGIGNIPGGSSTQSYVYVGSGISSGSEVAVKSKDGKTLITFTPSTSCQYLALSSPDIVSGQSYEVYSGGTLLATVTAGTGGGNNMGGPGGMGGGQRGQGVPGGVPREQEVPGGWRP